MAKIKRSGSKKRPRGESQNTKALGLIDGLDSEHQSAVPVLRKLASGQAVSPKELDTLDVGDSQLTAVVPILRAISSGKANAATVKAINRLDSFGEQFKPVMLALLG